MSFLFPADLTHGQAVADVNRYFGVSEKAQHAFTGSQFELFAGGGDSIDTRNRFTAYDLVAVSTLSVNVPAEAALQILGGLAPKSSALLEKLPADVEFEALTDQEFKALLADPGSPGQKLWNLLRQSDGKRWGIGETIASKLIARKRPHLVPIYDQLVASQVGLSSSRTQWLDWRHAFQSVQVEGRDLTSWLGSVRRASRQPHLSLLRVLDIVLWMRDAPDEDQSAHDDRF